MHAVAAELEESRARIRALLLPDAVTGRIEPDTFPRSAIFRFVFNTRSRQLAGAGLSMLLMYAGRRALSRAGFLPQIAQSLRSMVGLARH